MSLSFDTEINPEVYELARLAKKTLSIHDDYGEFSGYRKPSLAELRVLKALLGNAIAELEAEKEN